MTSVEVRINSPWSGISVQTDHGCWVTRPHYWVCDKGEKINDNNRDTAVLGEGAAPFSQAEPLPSTP